MEDGVTGPIGNMHPEHGGFLVDCAVMGSREDETTEQVFRARDGWILELVSDGLWMRHVDMEHSTLESLSLFKHIGEDVPHTAAEIIASNDVDRRGYKPAMAALVKRHRESKVDSELDRVFADLQVSP